MIGTAFTDLVTAGVAGEQPAAIPNGADNVAGGDDRTRTLQIYSPFSVAICRRLSCHGALCQRCCALIKNRERRNGNERSLISWPLG
jgi:hypothetical protein